MLSWSEAKSYTYCVRKCTNFQCDGNQFYSVWFVYFYVHVVGWLGVIYDNYYRVTFALSQLLIINK